MHIKSWMTVTLVALCDITAGSGTIQLLEQSCIGLHGWETDTCISAILDYTCKYNEIIPTHLRRLTGITIQGYPAFNNENRDITYIVAQSGVAKRLGRLVNGIGPFANGGIIQRGDSKTAPVYLQGLYPCGDTGNTIHFLLRV